MACHWYCYVDGACSNNGRLNAEASGSYAIYKCGQGVTMGHGFLARQTPFMHNSRFDLPLVGKRPTNNAAEAMSLLMLLQELSRQGAMHVDNKITVFMDSEITINHFYGIYCCKNGLLKQIHSTIRNVMKPCAADFALTWISGVDMKQTIIGH